MTEPSEETLREVYGAHIGHIAQMKADSLSFLRWTIGLTASFIGLSFSTLKDFEEFKPFAALLITGVALFCLIFVIYTQMKLSEARSRIEEVETKLRLREGSSTLGYSSFWYGWPIWVLTAVLSCFCALVAIWVGFMS